MNNLKIISRMGKITRAHKDKLISNISEANQANTIRATYSEK